MDVNNSLFQLAWATQAEKDWILLQLLRMKRQTMNIRLMKSCRFVVVKREGGKCIGWGGLDTAHHPGFPEFFSLYLEPDYRHFSLGMLIEFTRASHLLELGMREAFVRMTEDEVGAGLLAKRLNSGFYSRVERELVDPEYGDLCKACELFGKECSKQVFLKFNIEDFHQQCLRELGKFDGGLPKTFRLIRVPAGVRRVSGAEHEEAFLWKSYRPLWLDLE